MATNLDESARRAGAHQWAESRLFEVLGGWVPTTAEPEVRLLFDRHSNHCAWRAAQWWDRLPVLADVDRDELCRAPSEEAARAVEALRGLEGTVARLAGAHRVAIPRLYVAYGKHRSRTGTVADGSTLRTLGLLLPDLAADWHEGEAVLQDLLAGGRGGGGAVREAAAAVTTLEDILSGPI